MFQKCENTAATVTTTVSTSTTATVALNFLLMDYEL